MKKILLSIGLLATTLLSAQENWVNVESGGFISGATFRINQVFNNRIYVAGDTSSGSVLYSSPSGNAGTFVQELGINPVFQKGNLASSVSNSTYMFLASEVNYDTTGGVIGNTPQVYRYDGTTYTQHGTIDYSSLPPDNQMVSGNTVVIPVMALYSPTGSNDTIYAFEKTHYGAIQRVSVFKAPANISNPTWINCTNFSYGSGISNVYDAQVWHKKLYIAVNSNTNGGMILRTSNGADWDTVATGASLSVVLGVNSFNDYFTTLEVYKDTLVAGVINSFNASLVYTADSLTFGQTWSALLDSAHSSIMTNNVINNIVDMTVADGKLWIQTSKNFSGGPLGFVVTKNANNKDTLLTSTNGTGLESGMNYADDYKLSNFNGMIYSVGHSYGGAKSSLPHNTTGVGGNVGNIWRFNPVNPIAAFLDSVYTGTGYCYGNNIFLACTSANAADADWFADGSQFSSGMNVSFNPNGPGTYVIKMIAYNGTNQSLYFDTISRTITVFDIPHIDTVFASKYTVCQGEPDTLHTRVHGGTAPYNYSWHNVPDNIDYSGDSSTVIQLYVVPSFSPYVYTYVTVKDANMCVGSGPYTTLYLYVNPGDSLSGLAIDSSYNPVTVGKVYLFEKKTNHVGVADSAGTFDLSTSGNGKYYFPSLYYGDYYVKVVADTSNLLYKTSVGTYYSIPTMPYGHAFQWDSSLVIQQHSCSATNDTINRIKIIQIPNAPAGPGTITGNVSESNSFGQRSSTPNSFFGAPLKGVDIKLGKNPGGNAAARTTTDNNGNYSFHNVPLGQYKIYVDIPNYGMDSVRAVDLTITNVSPHNDYFVDSAMVRVVPIDSVTAAICAGDSIMLGGAYQHLAGYYTDVIQSLQGYDSVVVTNLSITALPTLTVTADNYTVCSGSPVTLTVAGATSYVWSSNAGSVTTATASVNPVSNTIYTVTGTANLCPSSQTISISTLALPNVTASSSLDSVCAGGSVTLVGGGATTYIWSDGVTNWVPFTPGSTHTYTVSGTAANTCVNTATVTVVVKTCIGIKQNSAAGLLSVYPTPATNVLIIETEKNSSIRMFDITGQMVLEQSVSMGKNEINVSSLPAGAYDLAINANGQITNVKVMISK
jgi:hypothetical protein